jgi:Heterokaryon incompatibility protein (HET)
VITLISSVVPRLLDKVRQIDPWIAQRLALETTVGHELTFRVLFADSDQPANIRPPSRVFDQVDGSRKSPDLTSYIAISYCWHYSSWQPAGSLVYDPWHWTTTHVQDSTLPVTSPMLSAFLDERKDSTGPFWIDQHSIRQENGQDKISAVTSMDSIYRCAGKVVVALDDVELDVNDSNALLKYKEFIDSKDGAYKLHLEDTITADMGGPL